MFSTYIIRSVKDDTLYIGQTSNLDQRIIHHNSGLTKSTKSRIPWKVVYEEVFNTRKEAIQRERFLKNQKNRDFYNRLINSWSGSSAG